MGALADRIAGRKPQPARWPEPKPEPVVDHRPVWVRLAAEKQLRAKELVG
jgi:hypothetical protein